MTAGARAHAGRNGVAGPETPWGIRNMLNVPSFSAISLLLADARNPELTPARKCRDERSKGASLPGTAGSRVIEHLQRSERKPSPLDLGAALVGRQRQEPFQLGMGVSYGSTPAISQTFLNAGDGQFPTQSSSARSSARWTPIPQRSRTALISTERQRSRQAPESINRVKPTRP